MFSRETWRSRLHNVPACSSGESGDPFWFTGERLVLDPGPASQASSRTAHRVGGTVTKAGAVHGNGDGSVMLARKEVGPVGEV